MNQSQIEGIIREEVRAAIIKIMFVVIPVQFVLTVILGAVATGIVRHQVERTEEKIDQAVRDIKEKVGALPEELKAKVREAAAEKVPALPKLPGIGR